MQVTLAGLGGGTGESLTAEARKVLERAELVLGAERLLENLPNIPNQKRIAAVSAPELFARLRESDAEHPCVVFSGDTGFYSGADGLLSLLREAGMDCHVLPGISSAQLLAARLGEPWQDWMLCSAHGTECDPVAALMSGRPAFFLTGGRSTPASICRALTESGLGALRATVGERLTYADERVTVMTAAECAERSFAPLSVLLAGPAPHPCERTGGIPDAAFLRGEVPMTKQEVRSVVLAKLGVRPDDTVWDVGAGTGSVSVELALAARRGRAYAVEYREEACRLISENRARFGAWNLRLVCARAPEALSALPVPDAVFIGGSDGCLAGIIDATLRKNPFVRLCVSAVSLETLTAALDVFAAHSLEAEVTQIAVSRAAPGGRHHLLLANNPVFLLTVCREEMT